MERGESATCGSGWISPWILLTVFWALLGANPAVAQGIEARLDSSSATVEDQLILTVTVSGSRSAEPVLPALADFEVLPRGESTQVRIVSGRVSSSVSRTYALMPKRPGRFIIPPISAEIDGVRYSTEPISVHILEADTSAR